TEMQEYPTQGRHGQGVINVRLPKEAEEVVAAIVGPADMELLVTTTRGQVKKMRLDAAPIGSRPLKPRPVLRTGPRNRVARVLPLSGIPGQVEVASNGEQLKLDLA